MNSELSDFQTLDWKFVIHIWSFYSVKNGWRLIIEQVRCFIMTITQMKLIEEMFCLIWLSCSMLSFVWIGYYYYFIFSSCFSFVTDSVFPYCLNCVNHSATAPYTLCIFTYMFVNVQCSLNCLMGCYLCHGTVSFFKILFPFPWLVTFTYLSICKQFYYKYSFFYFFSFKILYYIIKCIYDFSPVFRQWSKPHLI